MHRIRNLFEPKFRLYNTSRNYLMAKFDRLWDAERCLNLLIEQEKEWENRSHYAIKRRNKAVIYR